MVYTGKIISPSFFRATNAKAQSMANDKKNVKNRGINSNMNVPVSSSAQQLQQVSAAQTGQGSFVNNVAALTKSLSSFGSTILGDNNKTVVQENNMSGIAQGVSADVAPRSNLSSLRANAESVVNNGDKYTPEYFREQVVNNTLNPYV